MNFYILLFLIYVGCEDVDQEEPTPIFIKTFGGSFGITGMPFTKPMKVDT